MIQVIALILSIIVSLVIFIGLIIVYFRYEKNPIWLNFILILLLVFGMSMNIVYTQMSHFDWFMLFLGLIFASFILENIGEHFDKIDKNENKYR